MAANYWDSTQARFWSFTKDQLNDMQIQMRAANKSLHIKYELPEPRHLNIFLQQQLVKLGRRMNLRQQALATAQVYVRRYYLMTEIRRTNPYLVMTTAIYLACKMEECPVHIRLILAEAARQWPELGVSDTSKIGECEFQLISTLSSRLILHHPYRTLSELGTTLSMSNEEHSLAYSIINDHYNTDLPLMHPPHIVAITAIFLAIVLRPAQSGLQAHAAAATNANAVHGALQQGLGAMAGSKGHHARVIRVVEWLSESRVDVEAVIYSTQELISLYEVWETYSERACKEVISKFTKEVYHQ